MIRGLIVFLQRFFQIEISYNPGDIVVSTRKCDKYYGNGVVEYCSRLHDGWYYIQWEQGSSMYMNWSILQLVKNQYNWQIGGWSVKTGKFLENPNLMIKDKDGN